jgi:hypothetical protein
MKRTLLAALAALTLAAAAPALACDGDCARRTNELAQAAEKKGDKDAKVACTCPGMEKGCKCPEGCKCQCSHCHKDKKDEAKKS